MFKIQKSFLLSALVAVTLLFSGCAVLLVGGTVAGSYVLLTDDSVGGNFDVDYASLWFKAEEVLEEKGEITFMDRKLGEIRGLTATGIVVEIKIESITENTSRLIVKANKMMMPKSKEAQIIYNAIIRRI